MFGARAVSMNSQSEYYEEYFMDEDDSFDDADEFYETVKPSVKSKDDAAYRMVESTLRYKAAAARKGIDIALFVIAVAGLLALGSLLITRYELMTATNTEVIDLKNEIKALKDEIDSKQIQVEFSVDIASAQSKAASQMGMGYPSFDDILSRDEIVVIEKPVVALDDVAIAGEGADVSDAEKVISDAVEETVNEKADVGEIIVD